MNKEIPVGKTLIDLQDDDLTLARAYADSFKHDFDDHFLFKLEQVFRNQGSLTTHQWSILQRIVEKYEMQEWADRGNK